MPAALAPERLPSRCCNSKSRCPACPASPQRLRILEFTLDHEAPYFTNMRRRTSRKVGRLREGRTGTERGREGRQGWGERAERGMEGGRGGARESRRF